MIFIISIASVTSYLYSLIKFRGKWLQQQFVFLIIFLVGLTLVGELDILLPIYFVISLLPFIFRLRKISRFTGYVALYYLIYLIYGLIAQNINATFVTFIAKMWQFMIFFIVYDANIQLGDFNYKGTIKLIIIIETMLGIYLLFTSTNIDHGNGYVRLVSNAQPITGNISTVALPLSIFYYIKNRRNSRESRWLLCVNAIMMMWIVLSGTRGYTLEFAATMIFVFYDYFTNRKIRNKTHRNRIFVIFFLGLAILAIIAITPNVLEKFLAILRLQSSVGIRTYENAAILEFMRNAPLRIQIFGIGIGGTGGSYEAMQNALSRQFSLGMWDRTHYMNDSGDLFHNLYANVLLCLGIIGLITIIRLNIEILKRIKRSCGDNIFARRALFTFQLSFILMNYYRWSAVCGIAEMIVLALVLKLIKQNN